ncbi:ABC transporter substrate-binding protein [Winogradskyella rapida]|uniref:ABC transporter substrate-binding protein n=1 Tax=Winogradskyella rapida TaxID=549701 RepID=A0ABW3KSU0_9FLAO
MTFKDQLQRTIQLESTPRRIVSLVPSQTELLVDLGLEARLVGVTKFCVHPKHLCISKPVVGGTKRVHFDKIKALNPDIILCNKEENTKEMIAELEAIAPVHISDIYNLEDTFSLITMYGELFSVAASAEDLIADIQVEREAFQLQYKTEDQLKAAYFIWKKPWMMAASDNFIDVMLNEAGFTNAFHHEERYPEIDLEHPALQAADVIFLSSEPFPFKTSDVDEFQLKFPEKSVKIVDGEMFSWYGSRLIKAYTYFKSLH